MGEGTLPKCRCLLLAVTLAASISSTFAFAQQDPDGDRCKADRSEQQSQNPQQAPVPGDNSSGKLSDCEGVLKPPAVGDTELEKPAPEVGKTPVIRPGDTPKGQQNNQQPSK
ncbi:hypothetical protein G6K98_31760 [Agrobacterium rhizogenes]|nr:hypothetical protein [Rhizobium rhizogenes]NTH62101.1 hypothetical protein [Rhizobium rhizogenes]NTH93727.1 hypothetical protein [Rhizobium rhizogenes]